MSEVLEWVHARQHLPPQSMNGLKKQAIYREAALLSISALQKVKAQAGQSLTIIEIQVLNGICRVF